MQYLVDDQVVWSANQPEVPVPLERQGSFVGVLRFQSDIPNGAGGYLLADLDIAWRLSDSQGVSRLWGDQEQDWLLSWDRSQRPRIVAFDSATGITEARVFVPIGGSRSDGTVNPALLFAQNTVTFALGWAGSLKLDPQESMPLGVVAQASFPVPGELSGPFVLHTAPTTSLIQWQSTSFALQCLDFAASDEVWTLTTIPPSAALLPGDQFDLASGLIIQLTEHPITRSAGKTFADFQVTPLTTSSFRLVLSNNQGVQVMSDPVSVQPGTLEDLAAGVATDTSDGDGTSGLPDLYETKLYRHCVQGYAGLGTPGHLPPQYQGKCGSCVATPNEPTPIVCTGDGGAGGGIFTPGEYTRCKGYAFLEYCIVHNDYAWKEAYTGESVKTFCGTECANPAPLASAKLSWGTKAKLKGKTGAGVEIEAGPSASLEVALGAPNEIVTREMYAQCCVFKSNGGIGKVNIGKCQ